jgi:hypothetical protein
VDLRTEWTEDAYPPIAKLIAAVLNQDRLIVGNDAGYLLLLVKIFQQCLCGGWLKRMLLGEKLQPIGLGQAGECSAQ